MAIEENKEAMAIPENKDPAPQPLARPWNNVGTTSWQNHIFKRACVLEWFDNTCFNIGVFDLKGGITSAVFACRLSLRSCLPCLALSESAISRFIFSLFALSMRKQHGKIWLDSALLIWWCLLPCYSTESHFPFPSLTSIFHKGNVLFWLNLNICCGSKGCPFLVNLKCRKCEI